MRRAAVLLALPAVLLAGCANPSPSGGTPPPAPTTTSAPAPAPTTTAAGKTVTVDGVVQRGVEPGCLILHTATGTYELIGSTASSAPVSSSVQVSGVVRTDLLSHCQQGPILQVSSLTRH
jgi:hypothetical protein